MNALHSRLHAGPAGLPLGALLALIVPVTLAAGCDYDARERVQNFDPESGQYLASDVRDLDALDECGDDEDGEEECRPSIDSGPAINHLLAANLSSVEGGGASVTFQGSGARVCVIVDPQTVWRDDYRLVDNVEVRNPQFEQYVWDDGDLDLLVGLSAFYTGTPGSVMGTFETDYVDDLGVTRRADLNLCLQPDRFGIAGGTAGRGTPEWCSFITQPGVSYTVALETFSVPLDDNELRYVLDIREGGCPGIINECTLRGDADPLSGVDGIRDLESEYCG